MTRSSTLSRPRRRPVCRPRLENLEDRQVLSAVFDSVNAISGFVPKDIAVDSNGYTYTTGMLMSTTDFDPAVVRADGSDVLTPRGSTDAFIAKYAPDNTLVWARRMGGDYVVYGNTRDTLLYEQGYDIAVDSTGNVCVTGMFVGQADFGPFTLNSTATVYDSFVTKLDRDGNFLWADGGGAATRHSCYGIAVDASGNVISVGSTSVASHNVDAWLISGFEIHKYSPAGSTVWTKRIDIYDGSANSVATDRAGNVYLCGSFDGMVDFNPDPRKTYYVTGAYGQTNGYVLKLTASGAFGWVSPFIAKTTAEADSYVRCASLALDTAGNVIVSGTYHGQVDFNPSPGIDYRLPKIGTLYDGVVAKLSPTGALAWATPLGGAECSRIAVDGAGSVYVTGNFYSPNNGPFTPGFGLPTVTYPYNAAFVAKLTSVGALDWAVTFGGTSNLLSYGIAVDASGTVSVVGYFYGTADFNPDPIGTYELTAPRGSSFRLKLKQR
jgi:hypothetical protein